MIYKLKLIGANDDAIFSIGNTVSILPNNNWKAIIRNCTNWNTDNRVNQNSLNSGTLYYDKFSHNAYFDTNVQLPLNLKICFFALGAIRY